MRFPFIRRLRPALPTARRTRPCLELLEGRDLPSTFVVTNTSDSAAAGSGSLRRAILDSNANPPAGGANLIQFIVPGGGPQTITPAAALPAVTAAVFIDGATQPGFLAANAPRSSSTAAASTATA